MLEFCTTIVLCLKRWATMMDGTDDWKACPCSAVTFLHHRAEEMYERAMELIQLLSPGIVESESDYCTESSVNDEEW